MQMQTKTSIVILTHNKLEYTKLCINSIRKYTKNVQYELIVVDNASNDGTVNWLKNQKDITSIYNKENQGFSGGCNQGIEIANGTEILLLNNDTIVTPNWLSNLKKALYSSREIGAVGPVTNNCSNWQSIEVNYDNNDIGDIIKFGSNYNSSSNKEKWQIKIKLVAFCILIKKSIIDKVGLLDVQFFPGNFEDDDYSLRIIETGYKLLQCNDTFIHHYGNMSFKENNYVLKEELSKNHKKFFNKWNMHAVYPTRNDDIYDSFSPEKNTKLLEVGCSCGAKIAELTYKYPDIEIYGIDINKKAVEIAERFFSVIYGDIETMDLPYKEKFFDYIILPDLLSCIKRPDNLLIKLSKCLKDDGKIVISCYNFSHYDNIKKILSSELNYEDNLWGEAFSEDNIHVFNLNMLKSIVKKSDLNIVHCEAPVTKSVDKDSDININEIVSNNNIPVENSWQLKAYRYIMHLQKNNKDLIQNFSKKDSKKISFITCVNNDLVYKVCQEIIEGLNIPKGYNIEIRPVINAKSMAEGYNKAMKASNAKYKVYLHQDVWIINKNIIYDILKLFSLDKKIGLIGVAGTPKLPENAIWWEAEKGFGCLIHDLDGTGLLRHRLEKKRMSKAYEEVQAIDGNIMITQYDIPWREDLFTAWHFYDISQCMEFKKQGYKVIVPDLSVPWNIHNCNSNGTEDYDIFREIFLKEYKNML